MRLMTKTSRRRQNQTICAWRPTRTAQSPTAPAAAGAKTPGLAAAASAVPHSPQNFWPGELAVPHEPQTSASAAPHSPQNFWPDGLSAEHRGQIILAEEYRPRGGPEKASKATGSRRAPGTRQDCPGDWAAGSAPSAAQRPRRRARRFRAGLGAATRQPPQPASHNRVICAVRASGPGHYHRAHSRRSGRWCSRASATQCHHRWSRPVRDIRRSGARPCPRRCSP